MIASGLAGQDSQKPEHSVLIAIGLQIDKHLKPRQRMHKALWFLLRYQQGAKHNGRLRRPLWGQQQALLTSWYQPLQLP